MAECGTLIWRTTAQFPARLPHLERTPMPGPTTSPDGTPVRVALLGCGVVGSAVARLLGEHAGDLAARAGAPLELVGVAVRRLGRDRSAAGVSDELFTTDAADLVTRADVVVEVIGGIEPARSLI